MLLKLINNSRVYHGIKITLTAIIKDPLPSTWYFSSKLTNNLDASENFAFSKFVGTLNNEHKFITKAI